MPAHPPLRPETAHPTKTSGTSERSGTSGGPTATSGTTDDLTPKGRRTRARIVAAAAQLMLDHGVAGTTVEDVREAAGVSTSQIYHYFAGKQALIGAVIDYQTETIVGTQESVLTALDSHENLRAWRNHIVRHLRLVLCRGGCPLGSLGSELAETDADARVDVAIGFTRWEQAIRSGLHGMRERGTLAPDTDTEELALATLAALQGGLLLAKIQRTTRVLEAGLDAMLALVESHSTT